VTLVRDPKDYPAALEKAFQHSAEVIVEQFIEPGREVRCGVIEREQQLVALPLVEYPVNQKTSPIRTYDDKLVRTHNNRLDFKAKDKHQSWIVPTSDSEVPAVWSAALKCHQALGCRHYSLFDFRIDPQGQPWFIEAGLYCSFAPKSVLSLMAKAQGTSLNDFFEQMINMSVSTSTTKNRPLVHPNASST